MIVDGNGNIIEERRKANRRKEEKPKLSKGNRKEERRKNEKMYRTLGVVTGLTIAIILI